MSQLPERWVVLHCDEPPDSPEGVDRRALGMAFAADGIERVESIHLVRPVVRVPDTWVDDVSDLVEADTLVLTGKAEPPWRDGDHMVVVAADAPDLPAIQLGKLFRALGRAAIVAALDPRGWVVALGVRCPPAEWVRWGSLSLDDLSLWTRLGAAAPQRNAARTVPGWRRLRTREDFATLDPGLEGWDHTRALLRAAGLLVRERS